MSVSDPLQTFETSALGPTNASLPAVRSYLSCTPPASPCPRKLRSEVAYRNHLSRFANDAQLHLNDFFNKIVCLHKLTISRQRTIVSLRDSLELRSVV